MEYQDIARTKVQPEGLGGQFCPYGRRGAGAAGHLQLGKDHSIMNEMRKARHTASDSDFLDTTIQI